MKVITKEIKNTNEYSITRYSKSGMLLKTIIFIILYLIYMGLGMSLFKEILSTKMIIKFVTGSFSMFLFLYLEAILTSSKELLLIKEDCLILKKYIFFFCYDSKVIKLKDIRKIYYEKVTYKDYPVLFFPTDLLKRIKFRVKESEFEDKIYAFGYKMSEYESYTMIEEIEDVIKSKR